MLCHTSRVLEGSGFLYCLLCACGGVQAEPCSRGADLYAHALHAAKDFMNHLPFMPGSAAACFVVQVRDGRLREVLSASLPGT